MYAHDMRINFKTAFFNIAKYIFVCSQIIAADIVVSVAHLKVLFQLGFALRRKGPITCRTFNLLKRSPIKKFAVYQESRQQQF